MGRVVHFEFPVDDPERAAKFLQEALGWEVKKWESGAMEYWLVMTGDRDRMGIDGGFMRRMEAGSSVVDIVAVADIDEAIGRVEQAGGKIVQPKMTLESVGQLAYFTDTEGNVWGLIQPQEGAMM